MGTTTESAPRPAKSLPEQIEAATAALASIHDLLQELLETLTENQPPHRVSPGQLTSLQRRLDQVLSTIDDIVAATRIGGQVLLSGKWRIVLTTDPASPTFHVESVAPRNLGDGPHARLSDTRSGGPADVFHASLAVVRAIVARAAAQVALQQQQLATFLRSPAVLSDAANQVAAENRAAADQATSDVDLVLATSQLTRGHLLAAAQWPNPGR